MLEWLNDIEVVAGSPSGIVVVDGAWFIPGAHCIYDAAGKRVLESCIRRGPGLAEICDGGEETIALPVDYDMYAGELLYLSWLPNHWGHFLTESISRLWAIPTLQPDAAVGYFYTKVEADNAGVQCFLSSAGMEPAAIVTFTRPTQIRRIHIPAASLSNRGIIYTCHAGSSRASLPGGCSARRRGRRYRTSRFTSPARACGAFAPSAKRRRSRRGSHGAG